MNLHHLELFLAVAETGSVTRGAERVAISQPAVSRALADLEKSIGERLLDRGPKGVTLTAAGTALLGYARQIFALRNEAQTTLTDLHGLAAGELCLGASTTIGDHLLPAIVAKFLGRYPSVRLSLEVLNTEQVQAGVHAGRFDIGFTEGSVDEERFVVEVFHEDELIPFVAAHHPLARLSHCELNELAPFGFVMRESGSGTRRIVESHFEAVGFQPKIACTLGSTEAIKSFVMYGSNIGVASTLALMPELSRGELVRLESPLTVRRQLHALRLAWRTPSAALRRFLQLVNKDFLAPRL